MVSLTPELGPLAHGRSHRTAVHGPEAAAEVEKALSKN